MCTPLLRRAAHHAKNQTVRAERFCSLSPPAKFDSIVPNSDSTGPGAVQFCSDSLGQKLNNVCVVTSQEMRLFALDCLRWADEAANASQRGLMLRVAKSWMNTASSIDRHVSNGGELALPDLRSKLN
jgi:hypothetical protein